MQFIDLKSQYNEIKDQIEKRFQAVFDHGMYILGPEVKESEAELSRFCGAKNSVTVGNGTDALIIALKALGVQPGDEVITTPFSYIASSEAIRILGAVPKFVDICEDTFNINGSKLADALSAKTVGIMPVGIFGCPHNSKKVDEFAKQNNLWILEDAAQSFGAKDGDRMSGTLGTISSTSFFPAKPLGVYGDGGACFTDDDELAAKMVKLRMNGSESRYYHTEIGFNSRFDTLQAAVLLEKLKLFPNEIAKRNEIAKVYTDNLKGVVRLQEIPEGVISSFAQYSICVPNRDQFQKNMTELGVPTSVHYPRPIYDQPAYNDLKNGEFPVTETVASQVISLPMNPYLTNDELMQVVDAVKKSLN